MKKNGFYWKCSPNILVYILLILGLATIYSCSSTEENLNKLHITNDSFSLVKTGEKEFAIDSFTSPVSNSYQFHSTDSTNYLTFLNGFDNSIYFYDYDAANFEFKLSYPQDGPNGVGVIMGYLLVTQDSIFLYNYARGQLYLANLTGEIYNSFDLNAQANYQPSPTVSTAQPIILNEGQLWLSGNISGEYQNQSANNRQVLVSCSLKSSEVNYCLPYPEIYRTGSYTGTYRWVYHTINPSTRQIVVSFPASHDLYSYSIDQDLTTKTVNTGSAFLKQIEGFPGSSFFTSDKQALRNHFNKSGSYSSIIYDQFNDRYYRFASHPIMDYDEKVIDKRVGDGSIIIYDNKLNRLGETIIPKLSHWSKQLFVTPEGLNMLQIQDNEDKLIFSIYRCQKPQN